MMTGARFMPSCRTILAAVLLANTADRAAAQTIEAALTAAYESNPGLQAARAQLRGIDEQVPQALSGWRPTVTTTASYGLNSSNTRQPVPAQSGLTGDNNLYVQPSNTALSVSQPLFQGGRTVARVRQAENTVRAGRARLLAMEQQVLLDAATAYVSVVRDEALLQLATSYAAVLSQQLTATRRRLAAGEITRTDLAQAEARLASGRAAIAQAEGALDTSRASFSRVIGLQPTRLTPPPALVLPVSSDEAAARLAQTDNPSVVAALYDVAAARDTVDVQVASLLPQLSIDGQVYRNTDSTARGLRVNGQSLTLNLSVPLFQGGAEYSTVRQARQQATQSGYTLLDQARVAVQLAVGSQRQVVALAKQNEQTRIAIRAAEYALDGIQREAVIGSRTTLEVLNAQLELLNSRQLLVQTVAATVTNSYTLASAIGRMTARDLRLPVQFYDWNTHYRDVRGRWIGLGE